MASHQPYPQYFIKEFEIDESVTDQRGYGALLDACSAVQFLLP